MAENIVLSVNLNGGETVLAQLTQIDQVVNRLKANRNIKVSVNARSLSSAVTNAEKLSTSLTEAANSATKIGTTGARSVENAGAALKKASRNAESFRTGIFSVVGTMAKFRLASSAINLVSNGIKNAFQEMKAVDSELVNIRKVTGFAADEMERLSKNSFSLATKYGRSASEVLTGETVFARAGYTDQIEQLSELSLLLQNVGDLQADEASKFIIATDKAYKLGGSYDELMQVIDGLDNITNRNATDMQKMTEGMTVAGSVFAESGESVEMFAALLGTATANTQRSGSEMARGLRTILMNLRQIRGETEDGELIDGESIAAASKALKDYAGISTMENGQLRKASDVLADLAGKWDELTETQKAAISEAVAGKRQANVLMALMGDWESVTSMMQQYETAAGTAAQENAMYMDSWAAKTEQVKAAWTELVASVVSSDTIKGLLDTATNFIGLLNNFVNSGVGRALFDGVGWVLNGAMDILNWGVDGLDQLLGWFDKTEEKAKETAKALRDAYTEDFGAGSRYDELLKKQEALNWAEREELNLLKEQKALREEELAAAEKQAREAAKTQNMESLAQGLADAQYNFRIHKDAGEFADNLQSVVDAGQEYYDTLISMESAGQELTDGESKFVRAFEIAKKALDESAGAAEAYGFAAAASAVIAGKSLESAAQFANSAVKDINAAFSELPETVSVTVQVNGVPEAIGEIRDFNDALAWATGTGESTGGTFVNPMEPHHGYASGISGAPGGPALVNEKGPELIAANGLAWIAGGGRPTVTMLPRGATVLTAEETRRATGGRGISGIPAYASGRYSSEDDYVTVGAVAGAVAGSPSANSAISNADAERDFWASRSGGYEAYKDAWQEGRDRENSDNVLGSSRVFTAFDFLPQKSNLGTYNPKYCPVCGTPNPQSARRCIACGYNFEAAEENEDRSGSNQYWSGVSGEPVTPNFKTLEDELSARLKNLDMQAELAENQEDFLKAMQVYGEAQELIAELLEQYRANGYAEDSDEVLRLANLGYDYASKQLGGYDELQERLIDALNALTDATEDANAIAERQEAVDKAREALRNAESQRTVRIFNPVTGQWEWVANESDVQKARDSLKSAEDALAKEQFDQTMDAIKAAKPGELAGMTLAPAVLDKLFHGTPEQQTAFLNALNAASGGADYLGSDAAKTAWNQGNSIGTQYNLNGITLTESQAAGMTIKDLLDMLRGLNLMG